ncbi:MAG: NAD(P)/FAD-dependent oxidoreductase [Lysobacter sp.]|nr:MAG: NAD(P)/FAD-dependent oxidoreductase [Lysobacter sp.]
MLDCLIVGAGPGGLTAATYLVRFHRRALVVDSGRSRARWIPTSHNAPGFPHGVAGTSLLKLQREQAVGFGATIEEGCIAQLLREDDVFVAVAADGRRWRAHTVILATGIVDVMPALDGLESGIAAGAVRLCPVCDGYEASDGRVAVYGPMDSAIGHALFLRTFSRDVSVVASDDSIASDECLAQAKRAGIGLYPQACALAHVDGRSQVRFPDGREEIFDTLYPTLGNSPNTALAAELDVQCDDDGAIEVDEHQETSVDGLYAVGDVVSTLNQIAVAVGQAAIAATAVHNRLPRNWRERPDLQADTAPELPTPAG